VRFSIERIRTLVLVAAAVLVVAIGAFLGIARFRRPFLRRDIPQHLGINIQQEANGVTYTQAHGGHTVFKIHASRVVQLRDNRATLHDVTIELYGHDGATVDRIQGAEFDYDQSSSVATATGAVEIELQRPAAAGQQTAKGAKANSGGTIHVKTSGIMFNQQTGVMTTDAHVEFATQKGSGTALGARYDSDLGYLILNSNVELTTVDGANPVHLHAAHAEFNRDAQLGMLRDATAQTRSEQATAANARIAFRTDGSVERLEASNGITLSTQTGSHLAAPTGTIDFSARNEPHHAHLEGGVVMDSSAGGRTSHGTAPAMDLDFTAAGELEHAHLEKGVVMQSHEEQVQTAGNAPAQTVQLERTWHSAVADINFSPAATGQVEPASLHGTGGVIVTSETRRPGGPPVPSRLASDDLTAKFGERGALQSMSGQGHAALDETAANGAHESATSDWLEAQFTEAHAATSQSTVKAGGQAIAPQLSQLQAAQLDGHVVLVDQPAPKTPSGSQAPGNQVANNGPQTPTRATAGHAVYEANGAPASGASAQPEPWLHLTINPRVSDGATDLTADKIDIAQTSGDAFAHGNVKATYSNSGGAAQPSLVLGGGNAPSHIIAKEAELHHSTGEAIFRGSARLWQGQISVAAPVIQLDRQQQTMVAQSAGVADPVQTVVLNTQATTPNAQSGNAATKAPSSPSLIRIRSGDLHYSAQDRKAVLNSAPLPGVTVQNADMVSTSDQLQLFLVPVNGAQQAAAGTAGQSQIDRILALGHVALNSQGRRGTGAQLVYTAQTGNYVLTGTSAAPPRMTDPERGTVTGESLIFSSRDDSVSIEGGAKPTTTQTTAPR
jgi:lipopolysaccharide export system protein LptA